MVLLKGAEGVSVESVTRQAICVTRVLFFTHEVAGIVLMVVFVLLRY